MCVCSPHHPLVSDAEADPSTAATTVAFIDALNGVGDETTSVPLPSISQLMPLPWVDPETHRRVFMAVGDAGLGCLLPDSSFARGMMTTMKGKLYYHTIDKEQGTLESFQLDHEGRSVSICLSARPPVRLSA